MFCHLTTSVLVTTYLYLYITVNSTLKIVLILINLSVDLYLDIDYEGQSIYDKRDDFHFPIIFFPKITALLHPHFTYHSTFFFLSGTELIVGIKTLACLLAATLIQGNPDRNHKLQNSISTVRYILHMQVLLECCYK